MIYSHYLITILFILCGFSLYANNVEDAVINVLMRDRKLSSCPQRQVLVYSKESELIIVLIGKNNQKVLKYFRGYVGKIEEGHQQSWVVENSLNLSINGSNIPKIIQYEQKQYIFFKNYSLNEFWHDF